MKPDLVTFDCAHTLLRVNWQVGEFALECARDAGLDLDEAAAGLYAQLYRQRLNHYLEVNLTRDHSQGDAFWAKLSQDWLTKLGHDPDIWFSKVDESSKRLGFGPDSKIFQVYEDVLPCLDRLTALGVRTAVISNWDYSLHNILKVLGLYDRFDLVVASLEEGFEKPDPRIFLETIQKLGVEPARAAHVGDDPIDDLQGARNVGMRAVLIDRNLKSPASPPYVASLLDLPEALGWNA
jgi:REG-2-like HAD superfamily hydrolase